MKPMAKRAKKGNRSVTFFFTAYNRETTSIIEDQWVLQNVYKNHPKIYERQITHGISVSIQAALNTGLTDRLNLCQWLTLSLSLCLSLSLSVSLGVTVCLCVCVSGGCRCVHPGPVSGCQLAFLVCSGASLCWDGRGMAFQGQSVDTGGRWLVHNKLSSWWTATPALVVLPKYCG